MQSYYKECFKDSFSYSKENIIIIIISRVIIKNIQFSYLCLRHIKTTEKLDIEKLLSENKMKTMSLKQAKVLCITMKY